MKMLTSSVIGSKAIISTNNTKGFNLVYTAVQYDRLEILKLIVKCGANVNRGYGYQVTPLNYAIVNQNHDMFNFLLANGADATIKNANGETSLQLLESALQI